jgi:hypothetical protein
MKTWLLRIDWRLAVVRPLWVSGDAWLAVRIFSFAVVAPAFARLSLSRLERIVEPRRNEGAADPAHIQHLGEVVDAVLRVGRPFVRKGCLVRGLTLYHFLRQAGADVRLQFGLGRAGAEGDTFGDGYDGHCWLVKDGEPFLEARDPRPFYLEMYRFPSHVYALADSRRYPQPEVFRS